MKPTVIGFVLLAAFLALGGWLFFSPFAVPSSSGALLPRIPKTPKLRLLARYPLYAKGISRFDASGLTFVPARKRLLTVNDKLSRLQLFSIPLVPLSKNSSPNLTRGNKPILLQPDVLGKYKHAGSLGRQLQRRVLGLDLEGLSVCGDHLLAVSENQSAFFRIHPKTGKTTRHTLDLKPYLLQTAKRNRPLPYLPRAYNAGFEGLVCVPSLQRLFVIQERSPRLILIAKLPKTWREGQRLTILDHFDLPRFSLPQRIGRYPCGPDFSGAAFSQGFLYVIYRNARLVLKVDPKTRKLSAARSYMHAIRGLYQRRKPFGLAEGIALSKDRLWLILDNNARARLRNLRDRRPVLLEFARPKGF